MAFVSLGFNSTTESPDAAALPNDFRVPKTTSINVKTVVSPKKPAASSLS